MKYSILFNLIHATLQSSQLESDVISNTDSKFNKCVKIANLDIRSNQTSSDMPRLTHKFSHGSPGDIENYFWDSMIPICMVNPIEGQICLCPSTYEETKIIEDIEEGSFSVVTVNKEFKRILVSYRGATVPKNWERLFEMELVDADFLDGVKVHSGIQKHYQTLRPRTHAAVIGLLDQPQYSNHALHITGYSLGAALSTISAIDWVNLLHKRNDKRNVEIYAYAGPRVGNKAFVDALSSLDIPINRFTSSNDIIPHIPPRVWGYFHAGTELYYDPDVSDVRICSPDVYEDSTCNQKHTSFDLVSHIKPFDKPFPAAPAC